MFDPNDYVEWFTVETGPWIKVKTLNKATGFHYDRWVRFTEGRCLVPGCKYSKRGQIEKRIHAALEQHADEHIASLEGRKTATQRVAERLTLPAEDDAAPF